MLRGRSWVALAIAPALAACSLIYESDLDDARRPAAAAATVADAGGNEAVVPPSEAGADVVAVPTAGCGAFPTARFCDDFDTELNVGDKWDKLGVTDNKGKAIFDTFAYSPTRSLRASLADAAGCSYARLEKTFTSAGTKRVTVSMRMRPQAPWVGDAAILDVNLAGCGIILGLGADSPSYTSNIDAQHVVDGGLKDDVRDVDGFPAPDEWTDVTLDAKALDGRVQLDVIYDHPSGARDDKQLDLPQCRLNGYVFVGAGFHCSQDTHDVRYDDVRVSWE